MKVIITDSNPTAKFRKPGSYTTWRDDKIVDILEGKDLKGRFHYNSSGKYLNLKIMVRCNDDDKLNEIIDEIINLCTYWCVVYMDDDRGYCYIDIDGNIETSIPSEILCEFTDYFIWGLED